MARVNTRRLNEAYMGGRREGGRKGRRGGGEGGGAVKEEQAAHKACCWYDFKGAALRPTCHMQLDMFQADEKNSYSFV